MRNVIASNKRFALVVSGIIFCFLAVVARLAWLQLIVPEKYIKEAKEKTHSRKLEIAMRGDIRDSRGESLAYNFKCWDIGVDPSELADGDWDLIPQVAKILELPEETVRKKYEAQGTRWAVLKKEVSSEVHQAIMDLQPTHVTKKGQKIVRSSVKPVYGIAKFVRRYPKGELAAQLIGYVNNEGVPAMGIEKVMDNFLRGENGWTEMTHDRRGRELIYRRSCEVPARNGNAVELTIDARIQGIAEAECRKFGEKYNPKSICVIASEAGSGRLLALANWPTFNLNEFYNTEKAPMEHQRNRAVTDIYEPGSVFKTFTVAMALEENVITPESRFDCTVTKAPYFGQMRGLPGEDHAMGNSLSVREIVKQSSNRGSAQIGMRFAEKNGEKAFYNFVLKFGFGQRTNLISVIGEKGEATGKVRDPAKPLPEGWDKYTITRMPIGHGITVTPLQTHNAMSVIANGGVFWEPLLVGRILHEDGGTLVEYSPRSRGRVVKASVAKNVAEMLAAVCREGTGKQARIPGYEVAGKTGTSRKYINGRPSNRHHVGSFSGFFPASDPKVIITVVVDEPKGITGYGGSVAAPIFKKVAMEAIRQLEIKPIHTAESDEKHF